MYFIYFKPRVTYVQDPIVPAKEILSLEEINISRQKQNYRFYLFDK